MLSIKHLTELSKFSANSFCYPQLFKKRILTNIYSSSLVGISCKARLYFKEKAAL